MLSSQLVAMEVIWGHVLSNLENLIECYGDKTWTQDLSFPGQLFYQLAIHMKKVLSAKFRV